VMNLEAVNTYEGQLYWWWGGNVLQ
jgi:hypothetical protein